MNVVEIACCLGNQNILNVLLDEKVVKHERDFSINRLKRNIFQQNFVLIPILKRDEQTLAKLLDLTNLWQLQDMNQIILLCKQVKWPAGIEIVLKSKSCKMLYEALPRD